MSNFCEDEILFFPNFNFIIMKDFSEKIYNKISSNGRGVNIEKIKIQYNILKTMNKSN